MKYELIKTENYLLVVDDSEIKEGDYAFNDAFDNFYHIGFGYKTVVSDKKIIAHLPLNDSPVLEGIDLLPEICIDEDVNKIAWHSGSSLEECLFFADGYNKAKEKYKYTAEDMKKAYVQGGADKYYEFDKFINSLRQTKLPIAFEDNDDTWDLGPNGQTVWVGEYIFND